MSEQPSLDLDLSHLHTVAAAAFRDIGDDLRTALAQAVRELEELGHFPTEEESDRKFVEWYAPKRVEMIDLLGQFAQVYDDLGQKLSIMRDNVAVADWASADDLTIKDIPVYKRPDADDLAPKGLLP
ncbi:MULTISPECIES: hypothetical protein [Nonomuraea]|uniref:WXG100 family type VII secretion target n=1 Tax=Nonomuraea mangrovi TaxID=2316207 RepID=A0ABW4SSC8_9ACTN